MALAVRGPWRLGTDLEQGNDLVGDGHRAAESSWRHVTVLFTDLSDSTHLSGSMEAEVYADMLDQFKSAFGEAVTSHGGTVNQFQGDGLQALFGYPATGESDGQHAVEAALEVHARVRVLREQFAPMGAPALSVHSGVHTGSLLTRRGDVVAGRVELFGPAPGLAKHLSDLAEADHILVSEEALGPVRMFFQTQDRRVVDLKGRKDGLVVHRVVGRTALRTRYEAHARRGLIPFVGRRDELHHLDRVLEVSLRGEPAFAALSGAPGMGKTRLAEEFMQRAARRGWALLRGHCEDGLGAEPLQPFRQVLRQLLGLHAGEHQRMAAGQLELALSELDPHQAVHGAALRQLLSIPSEDAPAAAPAGPEPGALREALCNIFKARSQLRPHLLFIDDWQWSDEATRQVAAALRSLHEMPFVLLVTTRPLDRADAALIGADVIELRPLSELESRWCIARLLPQADPFVVDTVCVQSGGNPLYMEELCHSVARQASGGGHETAVPGPAWLEALIASRVSRLLPTQAELLRACAVIGNQVPLWLLQALTGVAADDKRLAALAEQDLLFATVDGQSLRFNHGITRDVVYGSIGLLPRRAMHLRLAQLILERAGPEGETESCEMLAHHFAGAAQPSEAAKYAAMAGDKALAASSLRRARAQYLTALEMLDRLSPAQNPYQSWRAIVRRLGFVCVYDPFRADLALLNTAVARARAKADAPGLAYAEYWCAYLHYALGDLRQAVAGFERAEAALHKLDDAHLTRQLRATKGQALSAAADYSGALQLLGGSRSSATARRPSTGAEAFTLACRASVLGDMGRFDESQACFKEALELVPRQGHEVQGSVLCWRAGVLLWQGAWSEALHDAQQAHQVAHGVKSLYLFAMSRAQMAYAQWRLDGSAEALGGLTDAAGWLVSRDKALFVSLVHGWLAEALAASSAVPDARRHAAQALWRHRQRDWLGGAMAARAMALLEAGRGRAAAARRHLARAEQVAKVRESAHEAACNAWCRAQVLLALGDAVQASKSLHDARMAFSRLRMDWHLQQAEGLVPLMG